MTATHECPCGSAVPFGRCCGPLHAGERTAETAEEVMRSRYSAYAVGDVDYVWRTWHPRTRPRSVTPSREVWTGLEILDVVAGQRGDDEGVVEFRAHYRLDGRRGLLHERSQFALRARRWFYVDGETFR